MFAAKPDSHHKKTKRNFGAKLEPKSRAALQPILRTRPKSFLTSDFDMFLALFLVKLRPISGYIASNFTKK